MKTISFAAITAVLFTICGCKKSSFNTANNMNSGLVLRYEFANNLADSSGNNFNGTSDTAIDFVPDRFNRMNNAVRFNGGTHNSYFLIPVMGDKQIKDTFAVSCWFTITAVNTVNMLYKTDVDGGVESGTTLLVNNGRLRVIFGDGMLGTEEIDDATALNANTWYHVVVTANGIGNVQVYLNGFLTYDSRLRSSIPNIGAIDLSSSSTQVQGLMGGLLSFAGSNAKLDDFRIYNRPLTASEVLLLYKYRP